MLAAWTITTSKVPVTIMTTSISLYTSEIYAIAPTANFFYN